MNNKSCLKVIGMVGPPLIDIDGTPRGILIDILDMFVLRTGICYKIRREESVSFGKDLGNGSFGGIIGKLQRKEIDIIASALSITADRLRAIDFTEPIHTEHHSAYFKFPKLEPDIAGFLKPFSKETWNLTLATLLVIWIFMTCFFKKTRSQMKRASTMAENSLKSVIFLPLAMICGQSLSFSNIEKHFKGYHHFRILLMTWLLGCLTITIMYKSKLRAMMTNQKVALPFRNLEEMVDQDELPFFAGKQTYVHHWLKISPEGTIFHKIGLKLDNYSMTYRYLDTVESGEHAILTFVTANDNNMHKTFSKTGRCTISRMEEMFLEVNIAMGIRKGASWKNDLDQIIIRLKEAGIISHRIQQNTYKSIECLKAAPTIDEKLRPLALKDFFGAFIMLSSGLLLSGIVFLFELKI